MERCQALDHKTVMSAPAKSQPLANYLKIKKKRRFVVVHF